MEATGGDTALWGQLLDQYKGRLPVNHRVFLNMATGVLDGECLTVYCNNDFVKDSLNNTDVLSVLQEVTSHAVQHTVQVVLAVGAPKAAAKTVSRPASPKKESKKQPIPTPPWESGDKLDELVEQGSQLEHFKIK